MTDFVTHHTVPIIFCALAYDCLVKESMGLYKDPFINFPLSLPRAFPVYSNYVQVGYYSGFILYYIGSDTQ